MGAQAACLVECAWLLCNVPGLLVGRQIYAAPAVRLLVQWPLMLHQVPSLWFHDREVCDEGGARCERHAACTMLRCMHGATGCTATGFRVHFCGIKSQTGGSKMETRSSWIRMSSLQVCPQVFVDPISR